MHYLQRAFCGCTSWSVVHHQRIWVSTRCGWFGMYLSLKKSDSKVQQDRHWLHHFLTAGSITNADQHPIQCGRKSRAHQMYDGDHRPEKNVLYPSREGRFPQRSAMKTGSDAVGLILQACRKMRPCSPSEYIVCCGWLDIVIHVGGVCFQWGLVHSE